MDERVTPEHWFGEFDVPVNTTAHWHDVTGEVLAVDLLSVKIRTFDNLFVRISNETLVKSFVTNFSRFPIRRYDLLLSVAYGEDMDRVKRIIELAAPGDQESLRCRGRGDSFPASRHLCRQTQRSAARAPGGGGWKSASGAGGRGPGQA